MMSARFTIMLASVALLPFLPSISMAADDAPPSYQADPGVYKLLFEDQNFRVIDAVRKPGEHDKPHSHPTPSIVYFLTDCHDKLYGADGAVRDSEQKAGASYAVPVIHSHSTENVGAADCHQIFVERK